MSETQTSLSSFDDQPQSDTTTENTDNEPEPESTDTSQIEDDTGGPSVPPQSELPPQTVWDTDSVYEITDGVRVIPSRNPDSFVSLPGDSLGVYKHEVTLLLDDPDDYLDAFDCHSVTVPQYYSEFGEMDPVVTKVTAGVQTGMKGINGRHLESVVRYIAMKGGFKHDELNVYAGPNEHFLVKYDGNTFVAATTNVEPDEPVSYEPDTTTVKSFEVPEDDPRIQDGLSRFVEDIETYFDYTIVDHIEVGRHKHVFETESGDEIGISGSHLARFSDYVTDPSVFFDDITIQTTYDEEYDITISESDIEHEIGDEMRGGIVVGYSWGYEDPRNSSRVSLSGKITVSVTYYYLVEKNSNRFELRKNNTHIARFDPENQEYNPLATP